MTLTTFPLRLPEPLKAAAAAQAESLGISLNQFITMMLATRVAEQSEAERYFTLRAARGSTDKALAALDRIGSPANLRDDDRIEAEPTR